MIIMQNIVSKNVTFARTTNTEYTASLHSNYLHKISVFCISDCDNCMDLLNQLLLLIIIKVHVPLGQTGFSSSVLNENEADLKQSIHT